MNSGEALWAKNAISGLTSTKLGAKETNAGAVTPAFGCDAMARHTALGSLAS